MSPAAPGNVELDQYIGTCLISQSSRNPPKSSGNQYQRQNTRQFHNSQNRNQQYQPEQFGKVYNGNRQKQNTGFHRQTNFSEANNGWGNLASVSSAQANQRRYQQYSVNNQYNSKARKEFAPNTELNRAPFSRLAMNNSNPPHIQNGAKFNSSRTNKSHFNRNNQKFYNKNSDQLESKQNQKDTAGRTSDVLSNISDESSGHSENILPRIIKPRKRRKKDRKPQTENVDSQVSPVDETQVQPKVTSETPSPVKMSPVVTLKPYAPLIYEQSKPIITIQPREESKTSISSLAEEYSNKKVSSCDEPIFSPLVTDSFVNLLLDEGKQMGNTPSSIVKNNPLDNLVLTKKDEEPSIVCQCRYCDPSGEIWDVEQRCYSPFLTPPAPNEPKLFINSIRSVISGNLNKSNAASYLLRRSWSEPSETSFTTVRSRNKSDSYEPNANDLQVSSEIITSPNGHRDIEIKFFSTAKRYAELYKPSNMHVPYSQMYYPSPPVSPPWKKEARFGDAFAEYSSVNVSV